MNIWKSAIICGLLLFAGTIYAQDSSPAHLGIGNDHVGVIDHQNSAKIIDLSDIIRMIKRVIINVMPDLVFCLTVIFIVAVGVLSPWLVGALGGMIGGCAGFMNGGLGAVLYAGIIAFSLSVLLGYFSNKYKFVPYEFVFSVVTGPPWLGGIICGVIWGSISFFTRGMGEAVYMGIVGFIFLTLIIYIVQNAGKGRKGGSGSSSWSGSGSGGGFSLGGGGSGGGGAGRSW